MRILATMKRFPAGVMVIPLLLGCAMNTFFPNALTIGGFTSGLFKNGGSHPDWPVSVLQRRHH